MKLLSVQLTLTERMKLHFHGVLQPCPSRKKLWKKLSAEGIALLNYGVDWGIMQPNSLQGKQGGGMRLKPPASTVRRDRGIASWEKRGKMKAKPRGEAPAGPSKESTVTEDRNSNMGSRNGTCSFDLFFLCLDSFSFSKSAIFFFNFAVSLRGRVRK